MLVIGQIGHDLVFSPNNIYNINICNFQIIFYFNVFSISFEIGFFMTLKEKLI